MIVRKHYTENLLLTRLLVEITTDRCLSLKADYSFNGSGAFLLATSLFRELVYCPEHRIFYHG